MEALQEKKSKSIYNPAYAKLKRLEHEPYISFEQFEKIISKEVGGIKYEWANGKIEKEFRRRNDEKYIVGNIIKNFHTSKYAKEGHDILAEVDVSLPSVKSYRRPDAAYFDSLQYYADPLPYPPAFLIEVISKSNAGAQIEHKVKEYFASGVQVVWVIYPTEKLIYKYNSPKLITVFSDNDICDVLPLLPDFKIGAEQVFYNPNEG